MSFRPNITRNWGWRLLAVWLILRGLTAFDIVFRHEGVVLGVLAIAAGVLILLER